MKNIQCIAFLTISINFSSGLQSKEIFTKKKGIGCLKKSPHLISEKVCGNNMTNMQAGIRARTLHYHQTL